MDPLYSGLILSIATDGPIATAWEIPAWPKFYVLDREGVIRFISTGEPRDKLSEWVDQLLSE